MSMGGRPRRKHTHLEQHHRRVGHLHKGERRRREEGLYDERRFERDVDQEHGGPGGRCLCCIRLGIDGWTYKGLRGAPWDIVEVDWKR
jgi:hypothetical protein